MTTMDEIGRKVHSLFKTIRGLSEWRRFSPLHRLVGLTVVTSIVAVLMERWALLIVLIVCVTGLAYFTDKALSVGWLTSPDPLARFLEGWERFGETLSLAYCRLFNTERVTGTQELRARSESIASSHIPDLDVDLDSTGPGSSFHKKIRLELNSIVLLIIRDFVQFWYHKFSYNSQFLKDSRQFLFRGFHNVVDRMSRLGPHQTSAKFIHAYRKHLSSFQTAQGLMDRQDKIHQSPLKTQPNARTQLKRLESVDEAFQSKFQFHPALKSKAAEKQYLRSLTKIILLCSCSRDVVSAHSAQLFLIEILSVNVLLPVVEMLSSPDRLYEIFIRLTYDDDDVMLNEDMIRELIDAEVKRMQLTKASTIQPNLAALVTQTVADSPENDVHTCADKTESSQNSGQCAADDAGDHNSQSDSSLKSSEATTSSEILHRKSKVCDVTVTSVTVSASSANTQNESKQPVTQKAAGNGSPKLGRTATGSVGSAPTSDPDGKVILTELRNVNGSGECEDSEVGVPKCECERVLDQSDAGQIESDTCSSATQPQPTTAAELPTEGTTTDADITTSAESVPTENNHVYGEMVSTNMPTLKPKLQAFKDLFKSKKSKQQEEERADCSASGKDQDANAHKSHSDTNGRSIADSILPTLKLRSLRLSPLLSRSSRLINLGNSDSSTSKDAAAAGKRGSDSEGEKQTPSPLPTPSPSQPSKGGPLSFFRFRKPNLEFRKSSPPAVEVKPGDSSPVETSAVSDGPGKGVFCYDISSEQRLLTREIRCTMFYLSLFVVLFSWWSCIVTNCIVLLYIIYYYIK